MNVIHTQKKYFSHLSAVHTSSNKSKSKRKNMGQAKNNNTYIFMRGAHSNNFSSTDVVVAIANHSFEVEWEPLDLNRASNMILLQPLYPYAISASSHYGHFFLQR